MAPSEIFNQSVNFGGILNASGKIKIIFKPGSAYSHFVINVEGKNNNRIHIKNVNGVVHFIYSHTYDTNSAEDSSDMNLILLRAYRICDWLPWPLLESRSHEWKSITLTITLLKHTDIDDISLIIFNFLYFQTLHTLQGTMRVSLLLVVMSATILLAQGRVWKLKCLFNI